MQILLATSNPHKLEEIAAIFAQERKKEQQEAISNRKNGSPFQIDLKNLKQLGLNIAEPVEDQNTFEANALLKARYYAKAANMPVIADDSGLEVDALNGAPGVHSARYAGITTGGRAVIDPANNHLLLQNLKGIAKQKRTARFVCVMALVIPGTSSRLERFTMVRGEVAGLIIGDDELPRGENGFGYDPLFYLPQFDMTTAQLSPHKKNELSHRGQAARLLWKKLPEVL